MEIVRNSINIAGLADENEIPDKVNGQTIQFSETEIISINENQPEARSIFQAFLKVQAQESRKIKTPSGYTVVLDGIKTVKLIYREDGENGKANLLELSSPFNTFIEVPSDIVIDHIRIYILDAYFDLMNPRKIYSNLLYYILVATKEHPSRTIGNKTIHSIEQSACDLDNIWYKNSSDKTLENPSHDQNAVPLKTTEINQNIVNNFQVDIDAEYL